MRRCLLVFEPPDGGVARHVVELAAGLSSVGWNPVVAGPAEADVYPALEAAGVEIHRLPIGRSLRPLPYTRAVGRLTEIVGAGDFDLVHAHSSKAGAIARVAARRARVPAVYTPHCYPFIGPQSTRRRVLSAAAERMLARITAATVCVSEDERREAIENGIGPSERLHVVHNGSAPCPAVEPDRSLSAHRGEGPLAACITVLRPQKAVADFVRAAPRVLERCPQARLAVVGNGETRTELEALARELGVDDRLAFLGFTAPAAKYLAVTDVFVLPSLWEAFPISILEAMACGVAQVATDVGGTREALVDGATGLLCPPGRPERLADAITELLADSPRRVAMGSEAGRRHGERFGLKGMVEGVASVYEAALEAR
jgi:glycosyltransferase involved in cell wall biosynthesis